MRWLWRGRVWVLALGFAAFMLADDVVPGDPVVLTASFDPARFEGDVAGYFAAQEARFDDITPGTEKRVVWAGAAGDKTPLAVVYLHGFSATSEEIRPVPDRVAEALGANLIFTRLAGHGRPGAALARVSVADWMADVAEALAAARAVGDRVVVIGTSTGATLARIAVQYPEMRADVAGMVLISPNFRVKNPAAVILSSSMGRRSRMAQAWIFKEGQG